MGVIGRHPRNGSHSANGDATVAAFQAFLDTRLRPLEQAAAIAAGQIGFEAERIRSELAPHSHDADRIDGLAEQLERSTATFAEDVARMRTALAHQNGGGPPSEGVAVLVRQMIVAGADHDEIEARLTAFGVEHPREVAERLFPD